MEINPKISRITIFPIKSLDGVSLPKAQISKGGCLHHDREFAMTTKDGQFIIGKTDARVHTLRSRVDFDAETISFRHEKEAEWKTFHAVKEKALLHRFLSEFFGMPMELQRNKQGRFLDIPDVSGVTVLAEESLRAISEWFPDMDLDQVRRRFRATLEIEGAPAFWEDQLFSNPGTAIKFSIGEVSLLGISPRARCIVPTRHPATGESYHAFPKTFSLHRGDALPEESQLRAYGHMYHLTVNCYIPPTEVGKWIQVGDSVTLLGSVDVR